MVHVAGSSKASHVLAVGSWPSLGAFQRLLEGGSSSKITHIDFFIDRLHEMPTASSKRDKERAPI